jgi:hypothetical protein
MTLVKLELRVRDWYVRLWSEGKGIKPSSINRPNLKSTTGKL